MFPSPSKKRNRVYQRKFDWDEARRLRYQESLPISSIARRLGVSPSAVSLVVDPEAARRLERYRDWWVRQSSCPRCGVQTTRNRLGGDHYCRDCANLIKSSSVRVTSLRCQTCRVWKDDDQFPHDKSHPTRRGRHAQCRSCLTLAKRAWRQRNPNKVKAASRRYREKQKLQGGEAS